MEDFINSMRETIESAEKVVKTTGSRAVSAAVDELKKLTAELEQKIDEEVKPQLLNE